MPILIVILSDENGILGQSLAEHAVLEESISEENRVKFGNLIGAHKEKLRQAIRGQIEGMIKQRCYVTGLREDIESRRLNSAGKELFSRIYKSPLSFPFDGFSTAKGNAADTCQELTRELMSGKLDFEAVIAKPVKSRNRAVTVLKNEWSIFTKDGKVSRRPAYPVARLMTEKWDQALSGDQQRISVSEVIQQLCRPPYGANIASAGLLFSVFVAPRVEKLVAICDGQQVAVSQLIKDRFFRGKFIDLSLIRDVDILLLGEASSEWDALLDEWEHADNHSTRKHYLERYHDLRSRVPVPPLLTYRAEHLREQSLASVNAITKMEQEQDEAISKIVHGEDRRDVSLLSRGAAALKSLSDKMVAEKLLWTESQISEIQPHYERARQTIILYLPEWLPRQKPLTESPDKVGDFKHKMISLIGGNLRKIGLEVQYEQVEKHTLFVIRNVQTFVDANQLLRDVKSWMTTHGDAVRNVRIAEIRTLREMGKDYARKLQGMGERIQLPEIAETRSQLSTFGMKLKDTETETVNRAKKLWQSKIRSETDIDIFLGEIESLVTAFDKLPADLEDLHLMQRALRLYKKDYQYLSSDNLNWREFDALADKMRQELESTFGEEELPWPHDEAIDGIVQAISKQRKSISTTWIEDLESKSVAIPSMLAAEANIFHNRASNPPPVITEHHLARSAVVSRKVEERLVALNVDWLLEKFKELSQVAKKDFLQRVQKLANGQ